MYNCMLTQARVAAPAALPDHAAMGHVVLPSRNASLCFSAYLFFFFFFSARVESYVRCSLEVRAIKKFNHD